MGFLFHSAVCSLRRKRGRTALTVLGIAIGVASVTLVSSIAVGSYAVAMSPFDANGAQIMAAYAAVYTPTDQQRRHVFNQLLKLAVWILLYQSLLAILGFYRIQLF